MTKKFSSFKNIPYKDTEPFTGFENFNLVEGLYTSRASSILITESYNINKDVKLMNNSKDKFISPTHSNRNKKKNSIKSLDVLMNFIDKYKKSDNYLKEGKKQIENDISFIKTNYKMTPNKVMVGQLKELDENLKPINETRPLFYINGKNEFKFFDKNEEHIMKSYQSINKFDNVSILKFKNIIYEKLGYKSNNLELSDSYENKYIHNSQKVLKILKNTKILKHKVLANIGNK